MGVPQGGVDADLHQRQRQQLRPQFQAIAGHKVSNSPAVHELVMEHDVSAQIEHRDRRDGSDRESDEDHSNDPVLAHGSGQVPQRPSITGCAG
jgi:hypothetical protein